MPRKQGFTLIELLVVMSIIMVLASMLLLGINAARQAMKRAQTQTEITNLMTAVSQYYTDLAQYPPSGTDTGDTGKLGDAVSGIMNHSKAWPAGWANNEHPLVRCLTEDQLLDGGLRTYSALFPGGKKKLVTDNAGSYTYLLDPYGNPYRYVQDGRRSDRALSRVSKPEPILWSAGLDGLEDPLNDQEDLDSGGKQDGRVDDSKELHDDICSWNQ